MHCPNNNVNQVCHGCCRCNGLCLVSGQIYVWYDTIYMCVTKPDIYHCIHCSSDRISLFSFFCFLFFFLFFFFLLLFFFSFFSFLFFSFLCGDSDYFWHSAVLYSQQSSIQWERTGFATKNKSNSVILIINIVVRKKISDCNIYIC